MKKIISVLCTLIATPIFALPNDFVYLSDIDPTIIQEMRYFTNNNFIGRPIKGYQAGKCILTKQAATALAKAQAELLKNKMSLKVFDCYRPTTAVADFVSWSEDMNDQKMKAQYYPNINKADVFKLGYVANKSGHSRGSTIDLTIVELPKKKELEMGTTYDFMDVLSHTMNAAIVGTPHENRLLLNQYMTLAGFENYEKEWWHFTLKDEPFKDTYFNFPVA